MAKMIHSMIRVLKEERSTKFYKMAFGLDVCRRLDFDDFTLVYLRNEKASFELELTINKEREEPYDLGDGYGHLAFCVDNLDDTHKCFENDGLNPGNIVDFRQGDKLVGHFFFVQDPDGYKIEILEKNAYYH